MPRGMQGRREPLIHFQIRNVLFKQWSIGGPVKYYCSPQIYLFIYFTMYLAKLQFNSGLICGQKVFGKNLMFSD